jgi:hypothetical protein
MNTVLRSVTLAIAVYAALPLQAQAAPEITITPFSAEGVTFSAYDPAASARFVQNHPEIKPLLPYSAILTNSTSKAIRQVTLRWLCADSPGAPLVPCGIVQFGGMSVQQFPARSKILVTTDHAWREDWADRYRPNPAVPKSFSKYADRLARKAALSVYVIHRRTRTGPSVNRTLVRRAFCAKSHAVVGSAFI